MAGLRSGRLLMVGAVVVAAAFLFGTDPGRRVRDQTAALAERLPDTVKSLAEQVDVDEIIGVLAERAIVELRPVISELLGQRR
ncbi:MAG: hypothetical protein ACUVX1_03360 [Chloroflexota bacterium]